MGSYLSSQRFIIFEANKNDLFKIFHKSLAKGKTDQQAVL